MSTASMALLKGSKKKTAPAPTATEIAPPADPETVAVENTAAVNEMMTNDAAPETGTQDEATEVEIENMSAAELDALVKDQEIDVPAGWAKMKLDAKKAWLNEQFGDNAEKADDAPATVADAAAEPPFETAAEPAPKKARKPKGNAAAAEEIPAAPAPTKGKTKPKAADGSDLIVQVASDMENLKEADARKLLTELREGGDFNYFKMGGVLSVIQANNWIEPHGSFKDFVEAEHGIQYRRAAYWVTIYNKLVESEIPWDKVKSVGWTKLKEIVPVLTKANVTHWVKQAEKHTTLQLNEMVKKALDENKAGSIETDAQESTPVTTMTFKLHADQKTTVKEALGKAKAACDSTVDTVALEFIMLDYLGGNTATASLPGQLQKAGLEAALQAFEKAFPNVDLTANVEEVETATAA